MNCTKMYFTYKDAVHVCVCEKNQKITDYVVDGSTFMAIHVHVCIIIEYM